MNKWVGIGRITAKPELNYTANQTAVTKFTIAVDRQTKDGGADFIRVTAFGRQAENICRYMDKGRQIAVEGRITTGFYHFQKILLCHRIRENVALRYPVLYVKFVHAFKKCA